MATNTLANATVLPRSEQLFEATCFERTDAGEKQPIVRVGRFAELNGQDIIDLWLNFRKFPILFATPKETTLENFLRIIHDPNSVLIDLDGIGVALISDVIPNTEARIHISFWDSKLRGREPLVRELVAWAVRNLNVRRVAAPVRADARAMQAFLERTGLYLEGVLKNWIQKDATRFYDLYLYGVTRDEADVLWRKGHSWAKPRVKMLKAYEA